MTRKKTTYEKKGLVRQLAGSLFAPGTKERNVDSEWRQKKTLFEKLDGADYEDDFELNGVADNSFSVKIDSTNRRYGNVVEEKLSSSGWTYNFDNNQTKKPRSIVIKPSSKDSFHSRSASTRTKKARSENHSLQDDPFGLDPFDDASDLSSAWKKGTDYADKEPRRTASAHPKEKSTFETNRTNPFHQRTPKLTKKNLDMVDATASFGIENVNPRSEFLQFTVDDDKESTIIDSVRFPDEEEESIQSKSKAYLRVHGMNNMRRSIGSATTYESKSMRSPMYSGTVSSTKENDVSFPAFSGMDGNHFKHGSLGEMKDADRDSDILSGHHFQSTNSLAYSASSCGETNSRNMLKFTPKTEDFRGHHHHRSPLSPLNVFHRAKLIERGLNKFNHKQGRESGGWADFSDNAFAKKSDPNENGVAMNSSNEFFPIDGLRGNVENMKMKFSKPRNNIHSGGTYVSEQSSTHSWGKRVIPEDGPVEDDTLSGSEARYEYGYTKKRTTSAGVGYPIGIQRLPTAGFESSGLSHVSSSSSLHSTTSSKRVNETGSYQSHQSFHQSSKGGLGRRDSTSESSFMKPLGLPNNAIMASMLFQRHHNIDTEVVEARLRKHEQAYKTDRSRGDIPQTVQATDGFSSVSSFSDVTGAKFDMWTKPTNELLDHFSRSRRTNTDFKTRLREERSQATQLYEA